MRYAMLCHDSSHFYAYAVLISWLAHGRRVRTNLRADLWLVVGHAIIPIDLAAPLIYITSIVYYIIRFS